MHGWTKTDDKHGIEYTYKSNGYTICVYRNFIGVHCWSYVITDSSGQAVEQCKGESIFDSSGDAKEAALADLAENEMIKKINDSVYLLSLPDGCTPGRYEAIRDFAKSIDRLKQRYPEKQFQYITERNEYGAIDCILAIVS